MSILNFYSDKSFSNGRTHLFTSSAGAARGGLGGAKGSGLYTKKLLANLKSRLSLPKETRTTKKLNK